jgi:hypothetical protein
MPPEILPDNEAPAVAPAGTGEPGADRVGAKGDFGEGGRAEPGATNRTTTGASPAGVTRKPQAVNRYLTRVRLCSRKNCCR